MNEVIHVDFGTGDVISRDPGEAIETVANALDAFVSDDPGLQRILDSLSPQELERFRELISEDTEPPPLAS